VDGKSWDVYPVTHQNAIRKLATLIKSAQRQPEKQKARAGQGLRCSAGQHCNMLARVTKKTASMSAHSILGSSDYFQLLDSMSTKFLRNTCLEVKLRREEGAIQWGI